MNRFDYFSNFHIYRYIYKGCQTINMLNLIICRVLQLINQKLKFAMKIPPEGYLKLLLRERKRLMISVTQSILLKLDYNNNAKILNYFKINFIGLL